MRKCVSTAKLIFSKLGKEIFKDLGPNIKEIISRFEIGDERLYESGFYTSYSSPHNKVGRLFCMYISKSIHRKLNRLKYQLKEN